MPTPGPALPSISMASGGLKKEGLSSQKGLGNLAGRWGLYMSEAAEKPEMQNIALAR